MLDRIRFSFRALRHPDLRMFLLGQGISLVGTWMQQVAMSWLVYRLTGSTVMLGVVVCCNQLPIFLVAGVSGALADRWSRHRMVVFAQLLAMLQAVVLAALVLTGQVRVWHLVALSVWLGLATGFDIPARQALLVRLVRGQEDLPNAIALNSSIFNGARLVGPALAGILIGLVGEGPVFVLNALSYLAVLGALATMETREPGAGSAGASVLTTIGEGLRYALSSHSIRTILFLLVLVSMVGLPYTALLPVFARDILGGGATTLGLLSSGAGLGALAGALSLASRGSVRGLGALIARCTALFGAALMAFAWSRDTWLSTALLALAGFGLISTTASMNTILQTTVGEEMRGRVMSLYAMAFIGLSPLGALLGGALAARIGAPLTVGAGGAVCLLLSVWFSRQLPRLQEVAEPSYEPVGIVPELAKGATDGHRGGSGH